jgi:predicted secreted protein
MQFMSGLVVFTIAWWVCFFTVLPIGVKGQWEDGSTIEGTEEAAPEAPYGRQKSACGPRWGRL